MWRQHHFSCVRRRRYVLIMLQYRPQKRLIYALSVHIFVYIYNNNMSRLVLYTLFFHIRSRMRELSFSTVGAFFLYMLLRCNVIKMDVARRSFETAYTHINLAFTDKKNLSHIIHILYIWIYRRRIFLNIIWTRWLIIVFLLGQWKRRAYRRELRREFT